MNNQIYTVDRSINREVFLDRISRAESALKCQGVKRNDVIAILLFNDSPYLEISLATARIGAFTVPINWHLTASEIDYILSDCQASIIIAHSHLYKKIEGKIPSNIKAIVVDMPPALLEAQRSSPEKISFESDNVIHYEELLSKSQPDNIEQNILPMGSILYTSGTTGKPKGVRRDAVTPEQSSKLTSVLEKMFGLGKGEVKALVPAPLYHAAPNMYASVISSMGFELVIMPRFDPEEMLRLIERHKISHIMLVPTMMHRLLRLPSNVRGKYDISSLQHVVTTAAHCPPEVKRGITSWWGPILYEFYGGTEIGGVTLCSPAQAIEKNGTVGKVISEAEVRIRGEDGNELQIGNIGEVYGRLNCFPDFTYINRDDQRKEIEWKGLITCGDIGYLDKDGFLFLCDRAKDMIISGGVNIYPAEIESALLENDAVLDCAIIGVPDEEFGESVFAYVVLEKDKSASRNSIEEFLRKRIAGYKIPKNFEFVSDLPREESGKMFKRKLRDQHLKL